MANPQKEDGYTAIANEILESLARAYLRPNHSKVLFVLLRKTYGWNKSEDCISLSQFSAATGLVRPNVCRAIKELVAMNIVIKIGNGYITKYRFQKDFDKWKPLPNSIKVLSNSIMGVTNPDKKVLSNSIHTKDIKPLIQKKDPARTKDEVLTFFTTLGAADQAVPFWEYYEMVGWVSGKARKPIKKWTMAAKGWIRRNKEKAEKPKGAMSGHVRLRTVQ